MTGIFGMPDSETMMQYKRFFTRPRDCIQVKFKFRVDDFAKVFLRYKDGIELRYLTRCPLCGKTKADAIVTTNRR